MTFFSYLLSYVQWRYTLGLGSHTKSQYNGLVSGTWYIYFWDWGPNSGQNWMISQDPQTQYRGIESPNLENLPASDGGCLHEVVDTVGFFRVLVD